MYYVCECGEEFDAERTGAREHMLEQHLDLIETRFDDFLSDVIDDDIDVSDAEIYEEAIDDVLDDLLDEFEDGN
jgi:hypothetical protein